MAPSYAFACGRVQAGVQQQQPSRPPFLGSASPVSLSSWCAVANEEPCGVHQGCASRELLLLLATGACVSAANRARNRRRCGLDAVALTTPGYAAYKPSDRWAGWSLSSSSSSSGACGLRRPHSRGGRLVGRARPGDGYSWEEDGRHAHEVKIYVPMDAETSARDVVFELRDGLLTLGVGKSATPVIDHEQLWGSIDSEDSDWMIDSHEGKRCVIVTLTKRNVRESWEYLLHKEGGFVGPKPDPSTLGTDWAVLDEMERVQHLLQQRRLEEAQEVLRSMTAGHVEVTDGRIEPVQTVSKGRGWRAAKDIKPGDVILYDTAWCYSKAGDEQFNIMGQQCMQKCDDPFFKGEVMTLSTSPARGDSGLLGILQNNSFECSREPGYVALFVSAARFNHSCRPNAFLDASQATGIVRALQAIPAGAEVTVSYVPVSDPLAVRKEKLAPFGFECKCERCLEEAKQDPVEAVPCPCGGASFQADNAAQKCLACGRGFDGAQSSNCLSAIKATNSYLDTAEAKVKDPVELAQMVRPLLLLEETTKEDVALRSPPPLHPEVLRLLDSLAALHYASALKSESSERQTHLAEYWACKRLWLERSEARHGDLTNQRDNFYVKALHQLLLDDLPSAADRKVVKKELKDICQIQFGQADAPVKLVEDMEKTRL
eukprot:TRINITY_DN20029_c0_g1_i1.p1 TRINITY_DN20029_c0_g1~~TRINITY_DN20029_c0_g1_i1.p1  ORF type:complete len:659 (-),score=166.18 TRINITY_DN20029_c0_g1_i1:367-2343(-)